MMVDKTGLLPLRADAPHQRIVGRVEDPDGIKGMDTREECPTAGKGKENTDPTREEATGLLTDLGMTEGTEAPHGTEDPDQQTGAAHTEDLTLEMGITIGVALEI